MAKQQRTWVVEGEVGGETWYAMSGCIFDNKRNAYQKLREIRDHWKDYPPKTFRIAEYQRKEDTNG